MEVNLVQWALSGTYDQNKPVLIDAENSARSLSKKEAVRLIARLAGAFPKDTTVCVHAANDILYPVLVLAILASGCSWTGTNPAFNQYEVSQHLTNSAAGFIITSPALLTTVQSAVDIVEQPVEIVLFSDILLAVPQLGLDGLRDCQSLKTLHDLLSTEEPVSLNVRVQDISCGAAAALMATSGTTGRPKMAERTHRSLVYETKAVEDNDLAKPYEIRRLFCTPIYHAFSFPEMAINALRLGYPAFFMKHFGYTFAGRVQEHRITETMAVPSMLLALVKQSSENTERHKLQSLRTILCAGAPLSQEVRSQFGRLFHRPLRLVQGWGLTECGRISTFRFPENDSTGSVGRAIGDCEICVSEANTAQLANGQTAGELLVRGMQSMNGYRMAPLETADTINDDGWLKTGDIGYLENGKVYLVDRSKDIIKVGGFSVSPTELEDALSGYPGVEEAAVVGSGYSTEEHPVVFIVAKSEGLSLPGVKKHLLARLSRHKVAKCEARVIDQIPRGANGKILRHLLRARLSGPQELETQ